MKTIFTVRRAVAAVLCVLTAVAGLVGVRLTSTPDNILPAAPNTRVQVKAALKATGRSRITVTFTNRGRAKVSMCVAVRKHQPSKRRCLNRTTKARQVVFRPRLSKLARVSPNGKLFVTASVRSGGRLSSVRIRRSVQSDKVDKTFGVIPTPRVMNTTDGWGLANEPYVGPRLVAGVDNAPYGFLWDFRTVEGDILCSRWIPVCEVDVEEGTYRVQVRLREGGRVSAWSKPSDPVWVGDPCRTATVTPLHAYGQLLSVPATEQVYIPIATLGPTVQGTPTFPKLAGGNVFDDGFRKGVTDQPSIGDFFSYIMRDGSEEPYRTLLTSAEPYNAPPTSTLYLRLDSSSEIGVTDRVEIGLAQTHYNDGTITGTGSCEVLWRTRLYIVRTG